MESSSIPPTRASASPASTAIPECPSFDWAPVPLSEASAWSSPSADAVTPSICTTCDSPPAVSAGSGSMRPARSRSRSSLSRPSAPATSPSPLPPSSGSAFPWNPSPAISAGNPSGNIPGRLPFSSNPGDPASVSTGTPPDRETSGSSAACSANPPGEEKPASRRRSLSATAWSHPMARPPLAVFAAQWPSIAASR